MTVEQLISRLMKVKDKTKSVKMICNAGTDFDKTPFIEEGYVDEVGEGEFLIELMEDMKPKY